MFEIIIVRVLVYRNIYLRPQHPWFEQNKAYLHFLQNQSSQKLTQLRTKQAELPMKNYEKEICDSVAQSSQVEFIDLLLNAI